MGDASRYGDFYLGVRVPTDVSADGQIFFHADRVEVSPSGALIARHTRKDDETGQQNESIVFALAPSQWLAVFAASVIDGHPVAIEHWKGYVEPRDIIFGFTVNE